MDLGIPQSTDLRFSVPIYISHDNISNLSKHNPPPPRHLTPTSTPPGTSEQRPTEMTGVDLEKCKRIVQYFWDPEPKNDMAPEAAIWCLGQMYAPHLQTASGEPST